MGKPIRPLPPIERLRSLLDYNPETGEITWKVHRKPNKKPGTSAGCMAKGRPYGIIGIDNDTWAAHRIAWALHYGEDPHPNEIDHWDRDPTNNRIGNLQVTSIPQQNANRVLPQRTPIKVTWPDGSMCIARGLSCAAWLTQTKVPTVKQRVRRNKLGLTGTLRGTQTGIEFERY